MPYRVDIAPVRSASRPEGRSLRQDALDLLVELGAIDVEWGPDGTLAALMPDGVAPEQAAAAFGVDNVSFSPATPRDGGSVWVLGPRAVHIGRIRIVPADDSEPAPHTVRLIDGRVFGTGLHATTALCLQALQDAVQRRHPSAVLDVGTGSGVLALTALVLGVPWALGIDIDDEALRVAAENARINGLEQRLRLVRGGPEAVAATWPLVLANVLAAPLIEMAPALVRRIGHEGEVVLSGIASSVAEEVEGAYRRVGLRRARLMSRDGWVALVMQASW